MLEWLKTILGDAYTAEIDSKVSAEIGKAFVARADFNAKNDAVKALEGQITERDKQIKGFEKLAGDNEALTTQLTAAQEANKTAKTEYEGNLKKLTISSRIETALMGAKAKNVKAVRALLDESKISLDGENVIGLNDQIEAIGRNTRVCFPGYAWAGWHSDWNRSRTYAINCSCQLGGQRFRKGFGCNVNAERNLHAHDVI